MSKLSARVARVAVLRGRGKFLEAAKVSALSSGDLLGRFASKNSSICGVSLAFACKHRMADARTSLNTSSSRDSSTEGKVKSSGMAPTHGSPFVDQVTNKHCEERAISLRQRAQNSGSNPFLRWPRVCFSFLEGGGRVMYKSDTPVKEEMYGAARNLEAMRDNKASQDSSMRAYSCRGGGATE